MKQWTSLLEFFKCSMVFSGSKCYANSTKTRVGFVKFSLNIWVTRNGLYFIHNWNHITLWIFSAPATRLTVLIYLFTYFGFPWFIGYCVTCQTTEWNIIKTTLISWFNHNLTVSVFYHVHPLFNYFKYTCTLIHLSPVSLPTFQRSQDVAMFSALELHYM